MFRFTGVLVLLALVHQHCHGQPTHDDSVLDDFDQWEDGIQLLERVIVRQEQQQRAQDERMERLEQMLNESIEGQRRLEMLVNQQQQHSEDRLTLIFSEKITEILSNLTQCQPQLFAEVGKEMERKMNESFILIQQSRAELLTHITNITDKSDKVQIELQRVQEEIRMHDERQLPCNSCKNTTAMLTEIEGVCVSVASNVNNSKELMTEEFQQQLLAAVNQTCMTSAEQSLQQHNKAIQDNIQQSSCLPGPRDCSEIFNSGEHSDGVYTVYLGAALRRVQVYCDMTTDGGGWTVFQRRQDGSEDFYRKWADYRIGFGNLSGEFWLGNDNLHLLTFYTRQLLRVDLGDFENNTRYAEYDNFAVGSAAEKYALVFLGTYNGTAGDSFSLHLGQKFSTRDQDNDAVSQSCAVTFTGAWWYRQCHFSNLNGRYLRGNHTSFADGVNWYHWTGYYYSLRFTEMKIRPFND